VEHENTDDRFAALEERFSGYEVYDSADGKVGEVDEIFVDEDGRPEYVGVKMDSSGVGSSLIPLEAVRVDEERRTIEVPSLTKGRIEDGPSYGDGREITPDFEQRVRSYYGLGGVRAPEGHGVSAGYRGVDDEPSPGVAERGAGERDSSFQETDELKVQRSEEEVRVGTREREAGAVKVRKSVRTEREQVRVPKRREEADIERVSGEGREASGVEIGEDDEVVVVQVLEEEVVVSKRVVVKEEIRIRKRVVEDEEVVEVDLRKEEVDIEDQTTTRGRGPDAELDDKAGHGGR
jgi:uncharacterized protein (TIGR02271 family)